MVAVITTGHSIRQIFNYNENKVTAGFAKCIGEGNYPIDIGNLNNHFKLNFLLKQLELNENVTRNSVHISLNFDPSEKDFSTDKLMEIANTYMSKIGFGTQPYLVYQHHDAAHPHIHIVSIKVKSNGMRIDMQNIGKNQSETARKEIERDFDLVKAQDSKKEISYKARPIHTSKIIYGKIESKKAISEVLNTVLNSYQYKSLPQLNAVLQLYNVQADKGSEDSRVFKTGGLLYRILDASGNPVGVPIKASNFYNKPTLKFLNAKFEENKLKNPRAGIRIKNCIRSFFLDRKQSLEELSKALEKEGISMVMRQAENGKLYGLTYVDHVSGQVCNGSELGKEFSAPAIQQNCSPTASEIPTQLKTLEEIQDILTSKNIVRAELKELISELFAREYPGGNVPGNFKKKRKTRKRNGQANN